MTLQEVRNLVRVLGWTGFRGLWKVRRRDGVVRWTITFQGDGGDEETEEHETIAEAVLEMHKILHDQEAWLYEKGVEHELP